MGLLGRLRSEVLAVGKRPSLGKAAFMLGVSKRTLQRRLQEEKTTFREVVAAANIEVVKVQLLKGDKINDIAFDCDYSCPAALHRAFKRLTGETMLGWLARKRREGFTADDVGPVPGILVSQDEQPADVGQ